MKLSQPEVVCKLRKLTPQYFRWKKNQKTSIVFAGFFWQFLVVGLEIIICFCFLIFHFLGGIIFYYILLNKNIICFYRVEKRFKQAVLDRARIKIDCLFLIKLPFEVNEKICVKIRYTTISISKCIIFNIVARQINFRIFALNSIHLMSFLWSIVFEIFKF